MPAGVTTVSHRLLALAAVLLVLALCSGCQPRVPELGAGTPEPESSDPSDPNTPALVVGDAVLTIGQVAPVLDRVLLSESLLLKDLPTDLALNRLTEVLEASYQALVDEQLLLAEARRRGLAVDDEDVENRIEGLREGMPEIYQLIVETEGLEGYRAKLRLFLLRQAAGRVIIAEQTGLCPPGEIVDDAVLLQRWLIPARAGTPVEILWRPSLPSYLTSDSPQGGG